MKILNNLMEKSRAKKYDQFVNFCRPINKDSILDVGVTNKEYKRSDNYFEKVYPFKDQITALGIGDLSEFSLRYHQVRTISYGGQLFPFKENHFDFVWSNAVIEHVGKKENQELFLSEILRVAKKKIIFTTPNRFFPLELHTRTFFIHWMPKAISDFFYKKNGKKWASGEYMNLLSKKDLIRLLQNLKQKYFFDYRILHNRIIGITATFTILISKK